MSEEQKKPSQEKPNLNESIIPQKRDFPDLDSNSEKSWENRLNIGDTTTTSTISKGNDSTALTSKDSSTED